MKMLHIGHETSILTFIIWNLPSHIAASVPSSQITWVPCIVMEVHAQLLAQPCEWQSMLNAHTCQCGIAGFVCICNADIAAA
jgi:hypothetical protein